MANSFIYKKIKIYKKEEEWRENMIGEMGLFLRHKWPSTKTESEKDVWQTPNTKETPSQ